MALIDALGKHLRRQDRQEIMHQEPDLHAPVLPRAQMILLQLDDVRREVEAEKHVTGPSLDHAILDPGSLDAEEAAGELPGIAITGGGRGGVDRLDPPSRRRLGEPLPQHRPGHALDPCAQIRPCQAGDIDEQLPAARMRGKIPGQRGCYPLLLPRRNRHRAQAVDQAAKPPCVACIRRLDRLLVLRSTWSRRVPCPDDRSRTLSERPARTGIPGKRAEGVEKFIGPEFIRQHPDPGRIEFGHRAVGIHDRRNAVVHAVDHGG
ncbi:MAG TPA: hypothetical protein PLX84_13170, partial [Acidiphilium sp.]|nr:hypothetical protein [Acidiphilium sp.]